MSHLNCLRTMPEITDEAVIEALFAQRPYEEKVLNSAYLEIPAEYQRELSIPNIERMSAEFTEWIANPPKVSYRDGHYYVFDGQHTLMTRKAMNGGADLPIICKVYYGLTQEEEAILFSRQTGVSAPLTAGAKLRAALFGKDAEAIAFLNATESTGLQLPCPMEDHLHPHRLQGVQDLWRRPLQRSSDHAGKRMGGRPGFSPLRYPSRNDAFCGPLSGRV